MWTYLRGRRHLRACGQVLKWKVALTKRLECRFGDVHGILCTKVMKGRDDNRIQGNMVDTDHVSHSILAVVVSGAWVIILLFFIEKPSGLTTEKPGFRACDAPVSLRSFLPGTHLP